MTTARAASSEALQTQTQLPPTLGLAVLGMSRATFTAEQREQLLAPFTDAEVELLPSGEVYSPHIHIRNRLNRIVGPGAWGLMPEEPQMKGVVVVQKWTLLIHGIPVASAYGEAKFIESNPRHSWGKALESLKSNALMRCAKDLGIGAAYWDKRFQYKYRLAHGVFVKVRGRNGVESQWRHLDSPPFPTEIGIDERSPNQDRYQAPTVARRTAGTAYQAREEDDGTEVVNASDQKSQAAIPVNDGPINDQARKQIFAALKAHNRTEDELRTFIKKQFNCDSTKQIQNSQLRAVLDYLKSPYDV